MAYNVGVAVLQFHEEYTVVVMHVIVIAIHQIKSRASMRKDYKSWQTNRLFAHKPLVTQQLPF